MNQKEIPVGTAEVLFERRGYLYIAVDNHTIKIKNTFDSIPDYVYIRIKNNEYEISQTPFPITNQRKKTSSKKK